MTTNKVIIILSVIVFVLIAVIFGLSGYLQKVTEQRDIQTKNVEALMMSVENYKTKDSLQAATVTNLQLSLSQYEQYRAADLKLIETLKVDNKRLQGIVTAQTESFYQHTAILRDSVKMLLGKDSIITPVPIKTANFANEWHSLNIIIDKDTIEYKLRTKESLLITNHVIPKRFLGFLWRYGVKEIRTEAVSKNPYTEKLMIESITIK